MSEWISVSERMPKEVQNTFAVVDYYGELVPYPFMLFKRDEEWYETGTGEVCPFDVIYWMPIPTLPEEIEDGTN